MSSPQAETKPKKIYLKDYQAPDFKIHSVDLQFDLHEDHALVKSLLQIERSHPGTADLVLDGVGLELISIHLDGRELKPNEYTVNDSSLCNNGLKRK